MLTLRGTLEHPQNDLLAPPRCCGTLVENYFSNVKLLCIEALRKQQRGFIQHHFISPVAILRHRCSCLILRTGYFMFLDWILVVVALCGQEVVTYCCQPLP